MGLLGELKKYVKDALPGGLLNPEVTSQGILDGAALSTTAVPVLGDLLGLGADLHRYKNEPETRTLGNFALSGLGMLPFVPNMAGMFIGKNAKTWDAVAMGKAQEMAKSGADPRAIWRETGTWQGPDGAWRQEIPDNAMRWGDNVGGNVAGYIDNNKSATIGNSIDHPMLSKAYPSIEDITLKHEATGNGGAQFIPQLNEITLNSLGGFASPSSKITSSTLHELQHVIQNNEGWAQGGNPSSIVEILKDIASKKQKEAGEYAQKAYSGDPLNLSDLRKPGMLKRGLAASKEGQDMKALAQRVYDFPELEHHAYQRLAGEAEARATQARMMMDAAQRRNVFPGDSYDVPLDQLIIRR